MAYRSSIRLLLLVSLSCVGLRAAVDVSSDDTGLSSDIITKYLQASQTQSDKQKAESMVVDIDASVPSLKEHGRLHALRKISKLGEITYRVLGFQGDNTVKNQVIARYLQAEQQGHGDQALAVTPANYKFKFKGRMSIDPNESVYVFQLVPREKRPGLFKGEMWLDTSTNLPVFEKGRLVKNPSIFFKKVYFERDFSIRDGAALPAHMDSIINTRIVGKVKLNVHYSNYSPDQAGEETTNNAEFVSLSAPATK